VPYKDPQMRLQMTKNWRKNNLDHCRVKQAKYYRREPVTYLWNVAKTRAKRNDIPFSISKADIVIPEFCPVLGIKLERGVRGFHDTSPSLDRVIPELGYVSGNVQVISFRANRLKSDGTVDEIRRVLAYMESAASLSI